MLDPLDLSWNPLFFVYKENFRVKVTYAYASCLKFNKNRKLKAVALISSLGSYQRSLSLARSPYQRVNGFSFRARLHALRLDKLKTTLFFPGFWFDYYI